MGAFSLIEQKRYDEFCALYREKSHFRKEQPEYADLMPGNYAIALIGAGQYERLVTFCLRAIEETRQSSPKIDRSSSSLFIALSIGYFALGTYAEAAQALLDGSRTAYQDLSRTQVPSILYYEAVTLGDQKALRESKKLLTARLKSRSAASSQFAAARFLMGKICDTELLAQINAYPGALRERARVQAHFYMAVKALEAGDMDGYAEQLETACGLYDSAPAVTMEFEFHLAELCRSKL